MRPGRGLVRQIAWPAAAYDEGIDQPRRPSMRKKLLQHTLSAAIAAWALSMAQGQFTTDTQLAAAPSAAQAWALR